MLVERARGIFLRVVLHLKASLWGRHLLRNFPFPYADSQNRPVLPYIAFYADGKLIQITSSITGRGNLSASVTNSIARGAVFYARDNLGAVTTVEFQETPPGNGLNTLIVVDALTGRGKREEPQLP